MLRAWLVVVLLLARAATVSAETAELEVFTREGCPRCAEARAFVAELALERPDLRITWREVDRDAAARVRLEELSREASVAAPGVPSFVVGGELVVGFDGVETTGARIRALLAGRHEPEPGEGALCSAERAAPCEPAAPADAVETSWFGPLRASQLGLPLFTIALGLVDGFNPCAMWVLLFLLSMLVNLRDRRRMALVAGVFVLASGVVYFAFMAAWLNVFLLLGVSRALRVALGVVALAIGAVNVKDFFALGRGVSLSIPARVKPGIYARARALLRAESTASLLGGVVVLALLVNAVELLCTAGLPAVYTAILSRHGLSTAGYYAYLALYNLAYVADDALMVSVAVVTLAKTKLGERAGRALKLASGLVMLGLALALLLFPELLV